LFLRVVSHADTTPAQAARVAALHTERHLLGEHDRRRRRAGLGLGLARPRP